ncbi:MAG: AAA family ATPase [Sphingomonas sp.]|nr:AAA family ATPase [Sphingomonas sp.]
MAPTLNDLGPRLCIMGPSNSGKSTLAAAIGRARGLPVVHLDQLHHQPHTDWVPRPHDAFVALHDAAISAPTWVIEGNYSRTVPQRLNRATGLILLDLNTLGCLARYLRRTLFENDRRGGLDGARERVTWAMVHHIAIVQRHSRRRNAAMFDDSVLPKRHLATPVALAGFYRDEGLSRG